MMGNLLSLVLHFAFCLQILLSRVLQQLRTYSIVHTDKRVSKCKQYDLFKSGLKS